MRQRLDYWAWKAGMEPIGRLLRQGWTAEEIVTRIVQPYREHKAEARAARKVRREMELRNPNKGKRIC
jgi:hypothetical protein